MIARHIEQVADLAFTHAFAYTSLLQIFAALSDLAPVLALPAEAFRSLTTLNIVVRPVIIPLPGFERAALATWLSTLNELTHLAILRNFYIYIFFDHAFFTDQEIDLSGFTDLDDLTSLEFLSLRIGGGVSLFRDYDFVLPKDLSRLRLTSQTLGHISNQGWPANGRLSTLTVEDERAVCHLRRQQTLDAARELSAALSRAVPAIFALLTALRLVGCFIDYTSILAVGELRFLTRLDFHPRSVELTPSELRLLSASAAALLSLAPPSASPKATHLRVESGELVAVGSLVPANPVPGLLTSSMEPLKYLLMRLLRLRLLRFGVQIKHDNTSVTAQALEDEFLNQYPKLRPFTVYGPSFLQLGVCEDDKALLTLHLAGCPLCVDSNIGTVSPSCSAIHRQDLKLFGGQEAGECPSVPHARRIFDRGVR